MRYTKDHKQQTRERIIGTAARLFKEEGINAVGIAAIMKSAGLTNGAFYAHFESKQALVEAVIVEELKHQLMTFESVPHDKAGLKFIINTYLSTDHKMDCANGCPSAALIGDISRLHSGAKDIYMHSLTDVTNEIKDRIAPSQANNTYALFGLLLGTLQMARSVSDQAVAEAILASGREAALRLAGAA
jgi:TetR/AcrR family transcriptional regulator, transcriptional repressor for nem operon